MAAFSQLGRTLIEFARTYRTEPAPGIEIVATPRYHLQLMPDFPIPGPNHASWIRCDDAEVVGLIAEVTSVFERRGLPMSWILDPDARPANLPERLREHGFVPEEGDEEAKVMVLPASARVEAPPVPGLEIRDVRGDLESFTAAEKVGQEAFGGGEYGAPSPLDASRQRRFANYQADPARHLLLATVDGEPAGQGSVAVIGPAGAIMNGGSVRPRFRGRGVYRSLVAARLGIAREQGAAGVVVWGGKMSAPILRRLGFETVSGRRFYVREDSTG